MIAPLISPQYLALNQQLHAERADYGAGAAASAQSVVALCRSNKLRVVLDYGCGKGTLKPAILALAPDLTVLEYDPAIQGKDVLPAGPFDLLVALDVMEHIEPECLDAVLETFCIARAVMLLIATIPAQKELPDGRNAHLIVQPRIWWEERLAKRFRTMFVKDDAEHFLYLGKPFNLP